MEKHIEKVCDVLCQRNIGPIGEKCLKIQFRSDGNRTQLIDEAASWAAAALNARYGKDAPTKAPTVDDHKLGAALIPYAALTSGILRYLPFTAVPGNVAIGDAGANLVAVQLVHMSARLKKLEDTFGNGPIVCDGPGHGGKCERGLLCGLQGVAGAAGSGDWFQNAKAEARLTSWRQVLLEDPPAINSTLRSLVTYAEVWKGVCTNFRVPA